jgi:signal transduction histidine kinase
MVQHAEEAAPLMSPIAGASELHARVYLTSIVVIALCALALTPWSTLEPDVIYLALVAALVVGELLTVQLRPNAPTTSLLVVPAILAYGRLELTAIPGMLIAVMVATLYRRVFGTRLLSVVAREVTSFAVAGMIASAVGEGTLVSIAIFTVGFIAARAVLWQLAMMASAPMDTRTRPDLVLCLLLAPLGGLPLLMGTRLGDGGLLVASAGVLAVMVVSREAANLSSARAEAEAERERLAQANALQEDLFHLISHDLKTPLAAVISYSQLGKRVMERNGDLERLATYLDGIESAGQNMRRLVENLLQISSLERGEELPVSMPVNLEPLAAEVVSEYQSLAEEKQIRLELAPTPDLPPALAYPPLLRQALANLVGNAVKYTPDGGTVTVWTRPGSNGQIAVGVTDTGIGMSEEDRTRLFSKFYRSSDPRARALRGSGLGLALTRNVVERMGGRIEVESELDKGSTFRMTLPVAAEPREER